MKKRIVYEEDYSQPELPHVMNPWFAKLFEECEVRDANEVKFGEQFLAVYTGQAIVYENEGTKDSPPFSYMSTRMEMKEPKPYKITIDTFGVYTLVNPSKLVKCPWGWRSECFKPQVKVGDKWREASDDECLNWSEIPEDKRRVIYCIGVLGNDENTS